MFSQAYSINDAGQALGFSEVFIMHPRTLDLGDDAGRLRRLGAGRLSLALDLIGSEREAWRIA